MEPQTFPRRRIKIGKVGINPIVLFQIGVIEAGPALNLQVWIRVQIQEENLNQDKEIRERTTRIQETQML